ncbi:clathrin interactor EPSIN 1-like isoform X1 [Zingiber officinale]|uniref:clathrin interactor EPSIN 1-like isoform X1 n=1 Tax=Zingiber officinale TaxID=94328 RepID=UPI001C4B1650|nr:clathrin interactor EPSIN 1-like isoform X1 [Zingiber officinale]
MDFMKVLDQTVREIKREVNLKVLKVPEIEQKVLDATNDEAWGPHGTALSEIAHATKKFSECQMIMGVLWARLTDTGPNWRHVYKALTVIEYLLANGSERAVDDILEHTFQISALSSFEYAEPNGKDVGINVRKKVETILAVMNDREKIQAVRDKAAANRDKYVGLSSKGISYKSSSASYSSSSYGSGYGSSSKEVDSFKDSYKEGENAKESKWKNDKKDGQNLEAGFEKEGSKSKKQIPHHARNQDSPSSNPLKISIKSASISSSESTNAKSKNEDDFDDFDPRGSSSAGPTSARANQMDLFGESLLGDLMDSSPSVPPTAPVDNTANHEVDLFADATFQSASHGEAKSASHAQGSDLFASQQTVPVAFDATVDLFAAPGPTLPSETKSPEQPNTKSFDPFAAIPINNFNNSDPFGTFASHAEPVAMQSSQSSPNSIKNNLDEDSIFGDFTSHNEQTTREPSKSSISSLKTPPASLASTARKDNFQVKSGVWSDCLSRGLIDLNISAPKKVNLADIGIVGGLEEAFAEKEKTLPAAAFIGRGMSSSSGLDWSGFSTATSASGSKSTSVQHQFGGFK